MKTNSNFGRLTGGALTLAPSPITLEGDVAIDGITHTAGSMLYTDRADVMRDLGYMPIVYTSMPAAREGFEWTPAWVEDGGTIRRIWAETPAEEHISENDYIEALNALGVNMSEA